MNIFSEQKNREFEQGFLGEKNYEISFRNLKSPTLKLSFDMHHLSLNKQSSYLGQRNQKYFNSMLTLKDEKSGRKIKAHITPYSQQNYDFLIEQPVQTNTKWKTSIIAGVSNACKSELSKIHCKDYTFGGYAKNNNFHNQLQLNLDEDGNYGLECSFRFFNYNKNDKTSTINQQNVVSTKNKDENKEEEEQNADKNNQQVAVKGGNTEKPFKFELSLHFKTIKFNEIQSSIFADLLFKKYEGVLSANFAGKSLKGLMCLFRYNSSLWLKLSSSNQDSNNNSKGGVELVYQHEFNKFIHLKNYINSNYTIATQLSYHPSDFVSLIYSATINIQKFKQESEDYKVGYGIHINF